MKFNPMRFLASAFALIIAVGPVALQAHPSGVSKLDLTLKGDTVEARVDVNRDDLFYALEFPSITKTKRSEIPGLNDRIAYYFQTRVDLKFDGHVAEGMKVLQWKKHDDAAAKGAPPARLDSVDLSDTTIALRMAWVMPKGTQKLDLGTRLFAELEVQPLSHLRVFYQGQEIKRKFMALDDRMVMPVAPDSLAAALAAAKQAAAPPSNAAVTSSGSGNGSASAPGPAAASDQESIIGRFLLFGFKHIVPEGLDHILFVLGLFFFSIYFRPLLLQVTAFTIAHSITLGLAMFGVFSLPSRVVEPLIALSITVVAVENIFFRKMRPSRWMIVFGFGLIHGMGFAGVLKELGLPRSQFLKVLVSFNVGVECGQLAVIASAAALTFWMWKKPWYQRRVVYPVSALIAAVGLFWFIQRLLLVQG